MTLITTSCGGVGVETVHQNGSGGACTCELKLFTGWVGDEVMIICSKERDGDEEETKQQQTMKKKKKKMVMKTSS